MEIDNKKYRYRGTWPQCEDGDEVVVLKKEDLELIVSADITALLSKPYKMDPNFYKSHYENINFDEFLCKNGIFTDKITYTSLEGSEYKLFLDRHFYSRNFKDEMWVRYVSVDQSFIEEGPDPPNGGPMDEKGL